MDGNLINKITDMKRKIIMVSLVLIMLLAVGVFYKICVHHREPLSGRDLQLKEAIASYIKYKTIFTHANASIELNKTEIRIILNDNFQYLDETIFESLEENIFAMSKDIFTTQLNSDILKYNSIRILLKNISGKRDRNYTFSSEELLGRSKQAGPVATVSNKYYDNEKLVKCLVASQDIKAVSVQLDGAEVTLTCNIDLSFNIVISPDFIQVEAHDAARNLFCFPLGADTNKYSFVNVILNDTSNGRNVCIKYRYNTKGLYVQAKEMIRKINTLYTPNLNKEFLDIKREMSLLEINFTFDTSNIYKIVSDGFGDGRRGLELHLERYLVVKIFGQKKSEQSSINKSIAKIIDHYEVEKNPGFLKEIYFRVIFLAKDSAIQKDYSYRDFDGLVVPEITD
jgi:hypothetical protein